MKTSKLRLGLTSLALSAAALLSNGCEVCVGMREMQSGCYQTAPCVGYQSPCSPGCYIPPAAVGCGSELTIPTTMPMTTADGKYHTLPETPIILPNNPSAKN